MFPYYRYKKTTLIFVLVLIISIFFCFMIISFITCKPTDEVKKVVTEFYTLEQQGMYSSSWMLFHPIMQEKFKKPHYIQDRAHVFMNHFGVETFSFTIEEPEKLETWKITSDSPTFEDVYKVKVTQTYESKYGNLQILQDVIVIQEEDQWKIAWDYQFHHKE
ncbi:MAG TPA: hypothetical protein VKZ77_13210 [Bacillaceae bacterium]|nr:hypothetical protein [Paenibacillus bovis]HLU23417.1 hypothetical protein [Bacillaceae bacterium]